MRTFGTDSGHRKAERRQGTISWDNIFLLKDGLSLKEQESVSLARFLRHGKPDNTLRMTYRELAARRLR